jgi:hypothetical protein
MAHPKNILMLALDKKVEALRMASGLTLLDDKVAIVAWGGLPSGPETDEQVEALEFAEVPMTDLHEDYAGLAARILASDVVYCV